MVIEFSLCEVCYLIMFPEHILMCISTYTYLVRCVLVLRCGLAGVVWYQNAGCSTTGLFIWNVGIGVNDRLVEGFISPGLCSGMNELHVHTSVYIISYISLSI